MQQSRKQSFLHGALILSIATVVVKVIGAIYKIPIQNIMTPSAAGHYKVAYDIYATLFVVATAGLPVAVSKMVSESMAGRRVMEAKRIFRAALITFIVIGVTGSFVLFFGADFLAGAMSDPDAAQAIRVIAPAVFFVAVICAYRGYCQGQGDMIPSAVSQVIEASFKLIIGLAMVWVVVKAGGNASAQAAGAMSGVTVGTVFGMVYMIAAGRRREYGIPIAQSSAAVRPSKDLFSELIKLAIPITASSAVLSITNLMDSALVLGRLQNSLGYTHEQATHVFGTYSYATTLYNLPPAFILTLAVSIIPAVAAAKSRRDNETMHTTILSAMRITGLLALPAAGGLTALAWPILNLLYGSAHPEEVYIAAPLLFTLGFAVLFVCLVTLTNSIIQSMGHVGIPVITMAVGGAIKIACNWLLVGKIGIAGAPIGTLCCYAAIAVLNMIVIARMTRLSGMLMVFAKPLLATAGMVAAAYASYLLCESIAGAKLAVIAAIGLGVAVYFCLILLLRAIPKADMLMLPKGEKLAKLLRIEQ